MSMEGVADAFPHKSETALFRHRGDRGLSSTVGMYRMTIKHCLLRFYEDCRFENES